MSRASCKKGSSWNYDSRKVWVDDGCMGEFRVTVSSSRGNPGLVPDPTSKQRMHESRPPSPEFYKSKSVRSTIVISQPGVYNYKNVLHKWRGSGKCNQDERQPPIMLIKSSDVTIKNFAYKDAPDGLHVYGSSKSRPIRNIKLENVVGWACEDALTLRHVNGIEISLSTFLENPTSKYRDKMGQLAVGRNVKISNTRFIGEGRPVRLKTGASIEVTFRFSEV